MSKLVVSIGRELRKKPAVVLVVFLAWSALLVVSLRLSWEDYLTSVYGYILIPTNKTAHDMAWFVGALPQLIEIAFGFWAIEKRSQGALALSLAAFLTDIATDVIYKSAGLPASVIPISIAESFLLFTIGSEFLLVVSFQNVVEYAGDAVGAVTFLGQRGLKHVQALIHGDDEV